MVSTTNELLGPSFEVLTSKGIWLSSMLMVNAGEGALSGIG